MAIEYIFELGELFEKVQMEQIFPDSKTFVDCIPLSPLVDIEKKNQEEKHNPRFNLKNFVFRHFDLPPAKKTDFRTKKGIDLSAHIINLWEVLTQHATRSDNSLIPLSNPYVVPGGRFREMFYWDSYFIMLGLAESDRYDLIEDMVGNFAELIDRFGYIPNGNRSYFLGRSQPPFFVLMIELLAKKRGKEAWKKYLPYLQKEHAFWTKDADEINEEFEANLHTVRLPQNSSLSRYYDRNSTPRPEAFKKDMDWAAGVDDKKSFFKHERAACESGWDFSSRWFVDGNTIISNRCADFCPIDLNCLLYYLEQTLSNRSNSPKEREEYAFAALKRTEAINKYFWNAEEGFYFDYNFKNRKQSAEWTIAAAFPLYFNLASQEQADSVAAAIEKKFLQPGGLLTTLKTTGQQWDAPNGWAPLQWIAIIGLHNYNRTDLAAQIAKRWMAANEAVFEKTGKMMEKYNVENQSDEAEAGTYPTQDGFGWTNGVYLACKRFAAEISER